MIPCLLISAVSIWTILYCFYYVYCLAKFQKVIVNDIPCSPPYCHHNLLTWSRSDLGLCVGFSLRLIHCPDRFLLYIIHFSTHITILPKIVFYYFAQLQTCKLLSDQCCFYWSFNWWKTSWPFVCSWEFCW